MHSSAGSTPTPSPPLGNPPFESFEGVSLPPLPPSISPDSEHADAMEAAAPPAIVRHRQMETVSIIPFDPNAEASDEDDDDDDEYDGGVRPRKRKSTRDLKAAAASSSSLRIVDDGQRLRRKIQIEYIEDKGKRHITFSKRKAGIMKKAYELATLTGTQVLLLVVSESGLVYTFTTDKFQPLVGKGSDDSPSEGQRLIQACLNTVDGEQPDLVAAAQSDTAVHYPTSARPFEANSPIHGGQVSQKTKPNRPIASSPRRVSAKRLPPPAIRTNLMPPVPPLPSPLKGDTISSNNNRPMYLIDPALGSPISPNTPNSAPITPQRGTRMSPPHQYFDNKQQQHNPRHLQMHDIGGGPITPEEYADLLQRVTQGSISDPYVSASVPATSGMGGGYLQAPVSLSNDMRLGQPMPTTQQQYEPAPGRYQHLSVDQSHYTTYPDPNIPRYQNDVSYPPPAQLQNPLRANNPLMHHAQQYMNPQHAGDQQPSYLSMSNT